MICGEQTLCGPQEFPPGVCAFDSFPLGVDSPFHVGEYDKSAKIPLPPCYITQS